VFSANTLSQLIEISARYQVSMNDGPQFGPQTQPIWSALTAARASKSRDKISDQREPMVRRRGPMISGALPPAAMRSNSSSGSPLPGNFSYLG
jgi:hypothetical protein